MIDIQKEQEKLNFFQHLLPTFWCVTVMWHNLIWEHADIYHGNISKYRSLKDPILITVDWIQIWMFWVELSFPLCHMFWPYLLPSSKDIIKKNLLFFQILIYLYIFIKKNIILLYSNTYLKHFVVLKILKYIMYKNKYY